MAVRTMTSVRVLALESTVIDGTALTSVLAVLGEELVDLVTDFSVRNLDIVLGGAVLGHEGEETIVSDIELV